MGARLDRLSSLAIAVVPALLVGCGPPPQPQAPAAPAAVKAPAPAAPAPSEPPAEALPEVLATEDGLVRASRPQGDGWDCRAEHVVNAVAGVDASYVQCRKRTGRGTVSLMAKDYQVPRASVMTAEALSTLEYPKHYRKSWDEVKYTRSEAVEHRGYPAYEVVIELSRATGAKLHLVERVVVVGTHTLNLSADAPPDLWVAAEADAKRWFDGADFEILRVDPKVQAALALPFVVAER